MPAEAILTITVYGEKDQVVFAPTPELLELLDLAALVSHESKQQFNYTFGSLLIGFAFESHYTINTWFKEYIEANAIKLSAIFAYQNFPGNSEDVLKLAAQQSPPGNVNLNQRRTATASSMIWLEKAKDRSEKQEHRRVGLRHLMGAIIFAPTFHTRELKAWGFKRPHWAKAFLEFVGREMSSGDVSYWRSINDEVFPNGIDPTDTEETVGNVEQTHRTDGYDPSATLSEDLPSIANDRTDGEAYIDIKADVASLGRIMCMRQVQPPLSIALFGQWGSGKSFFMGQLKKKVEDLKAAAKSGRESEVFYKDIIQIDFNAWHYVEANLWASLVSHIFETLKGASEKTENWEEKVKALLKQMGAAKQSQEVAQENLETAKSKAGEAQRTLIIKQNDAQIKVQALQGISTAEIARQTKLDDAALKELNDAVAILDLGKARETGQDVLRTLDEAKKFATVTTAFMRAFWRAPGLKKRLLFVGCAVGVPLLILIVNSLLHQFANTQEWKGITKTATGFGVMILGLLKPWMETKKRAEQVVRSIKKASADFDQAVADKETEERKKMQAGVDVANEELKQAKKALTDAEKVVEKAREALKEALPAHALMTFIEERSTSGDYRKSLGTLALVRQDFDKLSVLMRNARQANENTLKPGNGITEDYVKMLKSLPSIDRIILYIDDLDRCPPSQVIQVLQAIQLLLAFDLFVVVVGVDPRWVSRSLIKYYPELLSDAEENAIHGEVGNENKVIDKGRKVLDSNGAARPLDYLEKIFQIPFWLKPLGKTAAGGLIQGLLSAADGKRPGDKQEGESEKKQGSDTENSGATNVRESGKGATGSATGDSKAPSGPGETRATPEESTAKRVVEPHFASVKLTKEEEAFLSQFERLAGATPRAIKRFVNVYRLLRARVSKERESEFLGKAEEPREFEAVVYLLAMFNSAPELAQRFCMELEVTEKAATETPLMEVVTKLEAASDWDEIEEEMLSSMRTYAARFKTRVPTTAAYSWWFEVVARYSFVGQVRGISKRPNEVNEDPIRGTSAPVKQAALGK